MGFFEFVLSMFKISKYSPFYSVNNWLDQSAASITFAMGLFTTGLFV